MSLNIRGRITEKLSDSLYQNSIFLILTTIAMAGFGFIFWLISARLFSASDIGIATAIIPTTTMIAIGSLFGLDNSIVRFLHNRERRSEFIRSAFFLVTALSVAGSILFAVCAFLFSPIIASFFSSQLNYIIFSLLSIFTTLNLLSDAIFLANKRTIFTFIVTTTHSFLRVIFPFLFIDFGAGGILLAAMVAQFIGFILNTYILQTKWQYFDGLTISLQSLNGIWRYTSHNYIASIFTLLPTSIAPILIVNEIGTAESAYFYMVSMIINLLYVIPSAATKSLFAEGSHNEENILTDIVKSVYFILIFTLPAIFTMFLLAGFILGIFGADYATNGVDLLKILSISVIPYAIYQVACAVFRIKKRLDYLILSTVVMSVTEIIFIYLFVSYGLSGIGYAILLSNTVAAVISVIMVLSTLKPSGK
jgi:O-antigen/teichoic acid export membrane protein